MQDLSAAGGAHVASGGSRAGIRASGVSRIGITDVDVAHAADRLNEWLADGRHGDMDYLQRHAGLRADPSRLLPGALRVITARMDYLPRDTPDDWAPARVRAPA